MANTKNLRSRGGQTCFEAHTIGYGMSTGVPKRIITTISLVLAVPAPHRLSVGGGQHLLGAGGHVLRRDELRLVPSLHWSW